MTLRQLRYIVEVAKQNLNVTAAAQALYTSQPGVSKQIKLLEQALGIEIFQRNGKHFVGISAAGKEVIELAERVLQQAGNIKQVADDFTNQTRGTLTLATTHTQARYALPPTIKKFRERYPDVTLHIQQGTPPQIAAMAANGEVDFAIATEAMEHYENLLMLPCYNWNRCIITPPGHPLTKISPITIKALSDHPVVTYVFGFTGRSKLDKAFSDQGLSPEIVLTAVDSDVIKTYVKLGLGVGILANMAFDPKEDKGLVSINADHLFQASTTRIGFRQGTRLRRYMIDFIQMFAPHFDEEMILKLNQTTARKDQEALLNPVLEQLPTY